MSDPHLAGEGLATVQEAAEFLSVSKPTLYELLRHGELLSLTIGKARRVPWQALKRFVDERVVAGLA